MQTRKKAKIVGEEEQASTKLANGMRGVMSEEGLEGWKMQKHVQESVENGALAQCNVNEEQVQVNVEVRETSTTNLATIEVDLQKIIKMIVEQENVVIAPKSKEDENVIRHVEIDASDIFILIYNLLPTHPLYLKGWVGFVFGKFVFAILLLILVFKLLPHLPFKCEKVDGAFFWFKSLSNTIHFCR
jgi:hypothetical protein